MNEQVTDITVYSTSPEHARVGEDFVLRITVENTAARPQVLNAIDLGGGYQEAVSVINTVPAHKKTETNFATLERSYLFDRTIPAKSEQAVEFQSRGLKAGEHPFTISVCMNSDTNCETYNLKITISP